MDGHPVDGVGLGVGGAGIEAAGGKGGPGVDGKGDARDLGEAGDGLGRIAGGGFQGFQQVSAGDLNDVQGVAIGKDSADVLLGHIAGGDGGPDAAAVDHGCIHGFPQKACLPDHGIADEVAQVGFLAADIVLFAVEGHFALGEHSAVIGVDLSLDLCGTGGHHVVRQDLGQGLDGEVDGADVALGRDLHDTHICHLGAGGGQDSVLYGLAACDLPNLRDGVVGVTVQEEVNALHMLQQVAGPVWLGGGIHTQVADADDQVTALGGESVHLVLGAGVQLFPGQEGEALDPGGVGRGGGLRSGQAKDADAVGGGVDDCVGRGDGLALIKDVGGQSGKLCLVQKGGQGVIAVVELVVAQSDQVVSGQIHQFHRRGTLGNIHIGVTLAEVTGIHQVDVGPGGLVPIF